MRAVTKLSEWNHTRQQLSVNYRQLLAKHCPQVTAPLTHLMTVVIPMGIDRQAIIDHLRAQGIQAKGFCNRELTLPLHPGMTLSDVVRVVNSFAAALDAESLTETIA